MDTEGARTGSYVQSLRPRSVTTLASLPEVSPRTTLIQTVNRAPNRVSVAEQFLSIVQPAAQAIPTNWTPRRLRTVVAGQCRRVQGCGYFLGRMRATNCPPIWRTLECISPTKNTRDISVLGHVICTPNCSRPHACMTWQWCCLQLAVASGGSRSRGYTYVAIQRYGKSS